MTSTCKSTLKIGEFAKRFGLDVRTLRYYESIGLLPASGRSEGGYRLYTEADERLLRFVLLAKRVGFSLEEIRQMIQLGRHGKACDYVREAVERHIEAVDARIDELKALRAELLCMKKASEDPQSDCERQGEFCGLIERRPTKHPTPVKDGENSSRKRPESPAGSVKS